MQSPLPAVIFNAELQVTWANDAAGKVSRGRPTAQWRGRHLAEALPGMDVGLIERSLRSVLETGRPEATAGSGWANSTTCSASTTRQ